MSKTVRVEGKDLEGNTIEIVVRKPTQKELTKAQIYSARIFKEACEAGMCFRSKLEDYLINEGEWSDELRTRAKTTEEELLLLLKSLRTGKNTDNSKMKLSEGRATAIRVKQKRLEILLLRAKLREHDAYTVEGYVENARFDFMVHLCCFDKVSSSPP